MGVAQIVGVVLAVIIVLIFLLLLLPVKLLVFTDNQGEIKVFIKILFITIKPKRKEKSDKTAKKELSAEQMTAFEKIKTQIQEKGLGDTLHLIFDFIGSVIKQMIFVVKKCIIRKLKCHISVADEDAAVAAIRYGTLCTSVYSLTGLIDAHLKKKNDALDVKVHCDFQQVKTTVVLNIAVSIRIIWLVWALLVLLVKNKKTKK